MKAYLISVIVITLVLSTTTCSPAQTPTGLPPTSVPTEAYTTEAYTLATSIQDIVGTWHVGTLYLRFYEDGTLHIANTLDTLDDEPFTINEIAFEGSQMSLKELAVSNYPACGDIVGIYEARLLASGKMQLVRIEDQCSPRNKTTALIYDPVP